MSLQQHQRQLCKLLPACYVVHYRLPNESCLLFTGEGLCLHAVGAIAGSPSGSLQTVWGMLSVHFQLTPTKTGVIRTNLLGRTNFIMERYCSSITQQSTNKITYTFINCNMKIIKTFLHPVFHYFGQGTAIFSSTTA